MSIPGAASPLFLTSAAADAAAYQIDRSLRFNSADSAYLSRTPSSAGNRRTWSFSAWIKLSDVGTSDRQVFSSRVSGTAQIQIGQSGSALIGFSESGIFGLRTSRLMRDPGAWFHLVCVYDSTNSTEGDRARIYVNGVRETDFSTETYPSQNAEASWNRTEQHNIGSLLPSYTNYFHGYMAEIHFCDGQALAASDFGEYDSNNVWQPKDCQSSLTYGTNGFYLKFADNSSASNLGTDSSGNSNTWTVNNFSVASGSGNDSLIDTPTNYTSASGNNGGNYCTLNPLASDSSLLNGNLESDGASGAWKFGIGTIAFPQSGKWYFEVEATAYSGNFGIAKLLSSSQNNATIRDSGESTAVWYAFDGKVWSRYSGQGSTTSVQTGLATFNNGDIVGFGVNVDDEEIKFYVNGSLQYTYSLPSQIAADLTAGKLFPVVDTYNGVNAICNFGQRPFSISSVPTGHLSLCTQNLPDPTIADGSTAFDISLWTGNGTSQTISGLNHSPDLVWTKARSFGADPEVYDIVRGTQKRLYSSLTNAENTPTSGVNSFNSDGFGVTGGGGVNNNNATYVGWTWDAGTSTVSNTDGSITSNVRASQTNGFSIVSYSGNNTAGATVGHGLSAAPELVIYKNRDRVESWGVYAKAIGASKSLYLHNSVAALTANSGAANMYNSTDPSATVLTIGNAVHLNANGEDIIAYCISPVAGYSAVGSYTGNGSADGPFIYTGFRVAFLVQKRTDSSGSWAVKDAAREPHNVVDTRLYWDTSNSDMQQSSFHEVDFLSNGFKVRSPGGGEDNANNATFLYIAFAQHPLQANGGLAR